MFSNLSKIIPVIGTPANHSTIILIVSFLLFGVV